jgi:hypothetical protein
LFKLKYILLIFSCDPNLGLDGIVEGTEDSVDAPTVNRRVSVDAPTLNRRVSVDVSSDNNSTLQNIMEDEIDESNKDDDEEDEEEDVEEDEEEDVEKVEDVVDDKGKIYRTNMLQEVLKRKVISRKKMENQHNFKKNKRTHNFNINDHVSVFIPSVDRGHSDFPRLPDKITAIKGGKNTHMCYTIACAYETLNVGYYTKDLEIYNGVVKASNELKQISLRQAAAFASSHTKDLAVVTRLCNCNKSCQTNSCVCFKAKKKCTSHCHYKSMVNCCANKDKN